MSTAVLDVDLRRLPTEVYGLSRFDSAFVLARLDGEPIAQMTMPVADGRIDGNELRAAILRAGGDVLLDAWVRQDLGINEVEHLGASQLTATVAVCTRERPDDLRRVLTGIAQMPDDGQEVIVVDNCPRTDATQRVVETFPGVQYVCETRKGLNVARNRALSEATSDIVAFIDDDAVPDSGWLRALVRNFRDPLVYAVTGLTMPLELETPAQEAFEQFGGFGRGFRRIVFDTSWHHPMASGHVGAGVNMALRRPMVEEIGPFDEALDAGTPTLSGGDHEMFARILAAGYRIAYDPAALNWHRHRNTSEELKQTLFGYGVGVYAAWTRSLLVEHELGALKVAWWWFRQDQLPSVARVVLRRPSRKPGRLVLAELRGVVSGPGAYVASRLERRRERWI